MLRRVALSIALLIVTFAVSGCIGVQTPVVGLIYTEAKYGDTATPSTATGKEGKACAMTILSLVALGDASITTAKANGGITEVSAVDHTSKNILGIYGEWCTIVKGK